MANQITFFDLETIKALVANGDWKFANEKARGKYDELFWTPAHMQAFIACLVGPTGRSNGDFRKRFPLQSVYGDTRVLDADAYRAPFDEEQLRRGNASDLFFYIKLSIDEVENGNVAVVSFHLDN